MPSTSLTFASLNEHRAWLATQAILPKGFRTGATRFEFVPVEVPKPARMTVTMIACDTPTTSFAGMFTKNAFPGAPVILGRQRLDEATLGAIVINNKISNVCAPHGVAASERICAAAATSLGLKPGQILPCSTGVIGWQLPVDAMITALPSAVASLQATSLMPAAEGIVTTDLYPKVRRVTIGNGSIVGIAKGAGMIEPNLATMLVYILTDLAVGRDFLRSALATSVNLSFNRMSIDSDTSTSDTVVALSSERVPCTDLAAFQSGLNQICTDLCEDVVRNGEGIHHVIRVEVVNAPSEAIATAIGKSIVNSPLFQCAVCGNDPNVGRLVCAIGKCIGSMSTSVDVSHMRLTMGNTEIFSQGVFLLNPEKEKILVAHLRSAELYTSQAPADGLTFVPPIHYPPHERCVDICVDLGIGQSTSTIIGGDRSHEYISENADYRS